MYKIKGYFNDIELPLFERPNEDNENWYVWELTFPPNKTIKFDVQFLVNTNNSKTVKGYTNDYKNGFIYLIETGSLWKSPIEKGDFYVQFMDDISIEKVIENINFRDHNDETRKVSPLIRPKDSIEIDNTNLNIDQTFELAINHVQNHLNKGIGKNIN